MEAGPSAGPEWSVDDADESEEDGTEFVFVPELRELAEEPAASAPDRIDEMPDDDATELVQIPGRKPN